jgi:two-component system, NtrC family, sensor kinase
VKGKESPMRRGAKPGKAKVKAKPPIARRSRKSEGSRGHDLEKRLAEALEQQTATSEILRVISNSPTDVEPVFQTILSSTNRLCEASFSVLWLWDGEALISAAHANVSPELAELLRTSRARPRRGGSPVVLAALEQAVIHVPDVLDDPRFSPADVPSYQLEGARSILAVPLLRAGTLVGVINTWRREPRAFTDRQVELLKTFANQAVIAIENVRLFTELQASNRDLTRALDQQTATSEILQAIAHAQTDVRPVFDTIARSATHLCSGAMTAVFLTDGRMVDHVADYGSSPEALAAARAGYPLPVNLETTPGTAILTGSIVHVPDIEEPSAREHVREIGRVVGFRSVVSVPMLREGETVGSISVARREPGRFSDADVTLLKTFADQAVIAIENVRLFTELQNTNHALTAAHAQVTEALEQQTATGDILKIIAQTQADVQPVFDTMVRSAVRLCNGLFGTLWRFDGEWIHQVAQYNYTPEALEEVRRLYPARPSRGHGSARAILGKAVVHIPDVELDTEFEYQALSRAVGWRSGLFVPMLRDGAPIGALAVTRAAPGPFSTSEIDLLKTFADQAVIAVENVRLFRETEQKSRQLEAASRHKSEFLANMSHELRTPLNAVIGFSEVLLQRMFGELNAKQDEYLKDIYASGQHLLSLINDILDLSKIEAGRMELIRAPFHLPGALENAVTLVKERAARHGITLELDLDPRLGEVVGDERKVKQVLLNLLSNAVKFTPEGGRVSLKAGFSDVAAEIAVTDTGIGIAPEDQAAIFEEFRQVGRDETRKQEGTGLGLALAKKFIELHGGRIWVYSDLGHGSTFTFTLPVS